MTQQQINTAVTTNPATDGIADSVINASSTHGTVSAFNQNLVDAPNDKFLVDPATLGLSEGAPFYMFSSGSMPGGLTKHTRYYVVNATSLDFQVAATYQGSPINILTQGSGFLSVATMMYATAPDPWDTVLQRFDLLAATTDDVDAMDGATAPSSLNAIVTKSMMVQSLLDKKQFLLIGPTGSGADFEGDTDAPFTAAIAYLNGPGQIYVSPGTYTFSSTVTVPTGVLLGGVGFGTVTIAADGDTTAFNLSGTRASLDALTFTGTGLTTKPLVKITGSRCLISKCLFTDCGFVSLQVAGANNKVMGSRFESSTGRGVLLQGIQNTVEWCSFGGLLDGAVYIEGSQCGVLSSFFDLTLTGFAYYILSATVTDTRLVANHFASAQSLISSRDYGTRSVRYGNTPNTLQVNQNNFLEPLRQYTGQDSIDTSAVTLDGTVLELPMDGGSHSLPNDVYIVKCVDDTLSSVDLYITPLDFELDTKIYVSNQISGKTVNVFGLSLVFSLAGGANYYINIDDPNAVNGMSFAPTTDTDPITVPLRFPFIVTSNNLTDVFGELDLWIERQYENRNYFLYADLDVTYDDTTSFSAVGNIEAPYSEDGGAVIANNMHWDGTTLTYPKFYVQSVLNRAGRWVVNVGSIVIDTPGQVLYIELDDSVGGVDLVVTPTVGTYPLPLLSSADTERLVLAVCWETGRLLWLSGFRELVGGSIEAPFDPIAPGPAPIELAAYYSMVQNVTNINTTNDTIRIPGAVPDSVFFSSSGTLPGATPPLYAGTVLYNYTPVDAFNVDLSAVSPIDLTAVNSGTLYLYPDVPVLAIKSVQQTPPVGNPTGLTVIDSANDRIVYGTEWLTPILPENVSVFLTSHNSTASPAPLPGGLTELTKYYVVNPTGKLGTFNNDVLVTLVSGNYIYVGGGFSTYTDINSVTTQINGLAKIDLLTGLLDATFHTITGIGAGVSGNVYALALSGTDLYVGGLFSIYQNLYYRGGIAKIDAVTAVLDATFVPSQPDGFDATVRALIVSGNDLYVGGDFFGYNSVPTGRLAKLNATTAALDFTFDTITGSFNGPVYTLALDGSGLYVGGNFTSYKSVISRGVIKLNVITAARNLTFNANLLSSFGGGDVVYALALSGNALYIGGKFYSYNGISRQNVAKIDATTAALDLTFDSSSGFNVPNGYYPPVFDLVLSGNALYVAGNFTSYNSIPRQRVAKLDATSAVLDPTFDSASGADAVIFGGAKIFTMALSGSSLYIGGDFTAYKAFGAVHLAAIDATTADRIDPTSFQLATTRGGSPVAIGTPGSASDYLNFMNSWELKAEVVSSLNGNLDVGPHLVFPSTDPNDTTWGHTYYEGNSFPSSDFTDYTFYDADLPDPTRTLLASKLNDGIYRYSVHCLQSGPITATATLYVAQSTYVLTSPPMILNDLWLVWDIKVENGIAVGIREINEVVPSITVRTGSAYYPASVTIPASGEALFDVDGTPLPIARFVGAFETKNPPLPPSMFGDAALANLTNKASAHSAQLKSLYDRTNMYLEPATADAEFSTDPVAGSWLSPLTTGLPSLGTTIPTHFLQDRTQTWAMTGASVIGAFNLHKYSLDTGSWSQPGSIGNFPCTAMSKMQQGIALLLAGAGSIKIYDPDINTTKTITPTASTTAVTASNQLSRPASFPVGGQIDYHLQSKNHTFFKANSGSALRYGVEANLLEEVPHIYTEAPGDQGLLSHSMKDTGYNCLREPDTMWESGDNGISYTTGLPTGDIRSKLLAGNDSVLAEMAATNFNALIVENFAIDRASGAWMAVYKNSSSPPTKWYVFGGNDTTSYFYEVLPSSSTLFTNYRPMQWLVDPYKQEVFILGVELGKFTAKKGEFTNGRWVWTTSYQSSELGCTGCSGVYDHYHNGTNVGDLYVLVGRGGSNAYWYKYSGTSETWVSATDSGYAWPYTFAPGAGYAAPTSNLLGYGAASPMGVGFLVTDLLRGNRPTLFFYNRSTTAYSVVKLGDGGPDVILPLANLNSATVFYGAAYHATTNAVYYVTRNTNVNVAGTTKLFVMHADFSWSALNIGAGVYQQTIINRTGNLVACDNAMTEPKFYLLSSSGITTFTITGGFTGSTSSTKSFATTTGVPVFSNVATSPYLCQAGSIRGGEANVLMGSWVKDRTDFPVRYAGFGLDPDLGEGLFWTDHGTMLQNFHPGLWAGINRGGYLWLANASNSCHLYEFAALSIRGNVTVATLGTISEYDVDVDNTGTKVGFIFKETNNLNKLAFLLWDLTTSTVVSYQKSIDTVSYTNGRPRIAYNSVNTTWDVVVQDPTRTNQLNVLRRNSGGTWTKYTPAMTNDTGWLPSKPRVQTNGDLLIASCHIVSYELYLSYFTTANTLVMVANPLAGSSFGFLNPEIHKAGTTYWVSGHHKVAKSTSYTGGFSNVATQAGYSRAHGVQGYAYSDRVVLAAPLGSFALQPLDDVEMGIFIHYNDGSPSDAYTFAAKARLQSTLWSTDEEKYLISHSFTPDGKLLYPALRPGFGRPTHYSLRASRNEWRSTGDSCLGSGRLVTIGDRNYREEYTDDDTVTNIIYEYDSANTRRRLWDCLPLAEREPGIFTCLRYNRVNENSYVLKTGNPTSGFTNDTTSPIALLQGIHTRAFPYIGGQTRIQGGAGAGVLYNGGMLYLAASYLPTMGSSGMLKLEPKAALTIRGTFNLQSSTGTYALGPQVLLLTPATVGKHLVLEFNTALSLLLDAVANPLSYWTDLNYPQGKILVVLGEVREKAFVLYPVMAMHSEQIKLTYGNLELPNISEALPNVIYCAPASQYCISTSQHNVHDVTSIASDSVSVQEVGTLNGFQSLRFAANTHLDMVGKHLLRTKGLPPNRLGRYYITGANGTTVAGEEESRIEQIVGKYSNVIVFG